MTKTTTSPLYRVTLAALCLLGCAAPAPKRAEAPAAPAPVAAVPGLRYPAAHKVDQVDDYHGNKVKDPYRWLEMPDSKDTRAWVEEENKLTFGFLAQIPRRQRIQERLTQLWNFERYSPPYKEGGRYFYGRNDGLQNQNVVYTTRDISGEAQVLLDPNTLAADGTVALSGVAVSDDGKLMAYGLASAGSDWNEWHVRDIETGKDLPDLLRWIKFTHVAWTHDNRGFFYGRYKEPTPGAQLQELNYFHKLYYHRVGTAQSQDELVYERPDHKEWEFSAEVSEDGRYLVIQVNKSTDDKNRVYYQDLRRDLKGKKKLVELIDNFDAEYSFIGNEGPVFWFKNDGGAPRGRVIAIDTRRPDRKDWKEVIPQAPETLQQVSLLNNLFVTTYLKDAHTQVKIFDVAGGLKREVTLPGLGTASGFHGKRRDTEVFYAYTSYTTPATIYRLDLKTFASAVWRTPRLAFSPDDYETRQVFYKSKDGTRVPMFVSARKGLRLDGQSPTYLYGYGGFNISLQPAFSVPDLVFMEMGGVLAVPNLRGGGEYGQEWHKAGTKQNKQHVFDDFIAAAEWLIQNRYTQTPRLAIAGGSNGGLLVGACITQRPDLFGAALPAVGVMDMLRFHKFTIGWEWVDDYGSADNPDEFKALYAYSPLHNIRPGTAYPATLITTADHDDRVVPGHSFKFAAALQEAHKGRSPVLIRIETRAGHGAGKPTSKKIEEAADRLAFLSRVLKMEGMSPSPETPQADPAALSR